jgi:hypothetical protein
MDFVVIGMALVGLLIGSVVVGGFLAWHEAHQWSASATAKRTRRFFRSR